MNETLQSGHRVCGSPQHLDVQADEIPIDLCDASGQPAAPDWEAVLIQLSSWGRRPSHRDEDGALSPTDRAISKAKQVMRWLRENDRPTPTNVVEDADGGIVLTRRDEKSQEKLRVSSDGSVEYLLFKNSHLQLRQTLDLSSQ